MNDRGQAVFFSMMLVVVLIILAMALAPTIKEFTSRSMNESSGDFTGMNCSTTDNNFVKGTCIITDLYLPYFIGGLIAIAGGLIGARILFSEE